MPVIMLLVDSATITRRCGHYRHRTGRFTFGFAAWWFTLGSGIGFLIMAAFYARPLRKSGLTTISEYLVINFGPQAGPIASIAASLGIFFSIVSSSLSSVHLIGGILHLGYLLRLPL